METEQNAERVASRQRLLEDLKATEVRDLANGMPYRSECKKAEQIVWLRKYRQDLLERENLR